MMAGVASSSGRGSGRFVQPQRARAVARWQPNEVQIVRSAIAMGYDLDETAALLPHRSRDSVKDRYYRERDPQDRDEPAAICDARRQKDASEGSARLLQALKDAGFVTVIYPRKIA